MSGTASTFSVGRDIQFVLVGPTGTLQMPKITKFHSVPIYEKAASKVLDGPTRMLPLPDGHKVTIGFDREDSGLDDFFSAYEALYWSLGQVPVFTGYGYVTERKDGSQSTYEWAEFTLEYQPGEWVSGKAISGSLEGYARYWKKI